MNELDKLTAKVTAALELIGSDEADEIIGEAGGDCQVLEQGMDALQKMGWQAARRFGLRSNENSRQIWGQHTIVALQLVHNAYALGKKAGMQDG